MPEKPKQNKNIGTFLRFFPLALCVALVVMAVLFLNKSTTGKANSLKRQAKTEYYAHEFVKAAHTYQYLADSMHAQEDELMLNYANAAFLASDIARDPNDIRLGKPDSTDNAADTSKVKPLSFADISAQEYSKLAASGRTAVSSMAANQMGVSKVKSAEKNPSPAALDSALRQSLVNFKEALQNDPDNDSARYNYELVKKLVEYPDNVLAQVTGLVAKRQYKQAEMVLTAAMQRDKRIKQQQQDLLKRIKEVVSIDSLDTKTSL